MKTVRARRKSLIAGLPAWLASLVAAAIAGSAFSYLLQYVLAADPGLRADNRLGVVFYGGIWVICVAAASMIAGCCLVFGWRPRRSELGLLGLCSIAVVLAVAAIPPLSAGANMLGAFVLAVALGIL